MLVEIASSPLKPPEVLASILIHTREVVHELWPTPAAKSGEVALKADRRNVQLEDLPDL